ncbi:11262_t:CDS:2, partial [Racocetra persica]
MADQADNIEANASYTVSAEASTSYSYAIIVDQAANAKTYVTNSEVSNFQVVNAEITNSYTTTAQIDTSHSANTKANTLYENAIYDDVRTSYANTTTEEIKSIGISNAVIWCISNADDVDSFLKAYGQYNGFAIIKKRVEQRNDGPLGKMCLTFLDMDLANAIQHFKVKSRDLTEDASHLLSFLIEKRS